MTFVKRNRIDQWPPRVRGLLALLLFPFVLIAVLYDLLTRISLACMSASRSWWSYANFCVREGLGLAWSLLIYGESR